MRGLLAEDALASIATILAAADVPVMPLKGVLLQRTVRARAPFRAMRDIDVLVPPARWRAATRALRRGGYRLAFRARSGIEESYWSPDRVIVDLHRQLFGPGRFAMRTEDVFARARLDEAIFGAKVWLPCPLDVYAHAIGKLVSDHADEREARRIREPEEIARHWSLEPEDAASHLIHCGLGRASRYSLCLIVDAGDAPFAREVLARLPPDPLGDALARVALGIVRASPPQSPIGSAPVHLLERDLVRAVTAMAGTAGARLHWWATERRT